MNSTNPPLPIGLWSLMFGNLVIGTGVLVVFGSLNDLAESLNVSTAKAGQIITAGAITMCLSAPILATIIGSVNRRLLLTFSMLWYAACLAISALMPNYESLIVMRVLTVFAPALFTAQAAVCAGMMVPETQRGKAITLVMLGWALSFLVGVPFANWLSGYYGWQVTFMVVAAASLLSAYSLYAYLPNNLHPAALSKANWQAVLKHPLLIPGALLTVLYSAGQFVLFSYLTPVLRDQIGLNIDQSSLLLVGFGLCGVAGSVLSSQLIDRLGTDRMVLLCLLMISLALGLWPLANNIVISALILAPWGLVFITIHSAQQARMVSIAPLLASASMALITSGMYIGQGLGAIIGGTIMSTDNPLWLGPTGVLIMLVGIILSVRITRQAAFS